MKSFSKTFSMTVNDMDVNYRITPSAVLLFAQEAIALFMEEKKVAPRHIAKDNMLWVISDFQVKIVNGKPCWPSDITAEVWASERMSVRFYFDFRLKDGEGKVFAEGSSAWAVLNTESRRPAMDYDRLGVFDIVPDLVFGKHFKPILPATSGKLDSISYRTMTTDVDFNGHVSNRVYLSAAMGGFPLDYVKAHSFEQMTIKFERETFLGDGLHCHRYACEGKDDNYITAIRNDAGENVCHIWTSWE